MACHDAIGCAHLNRAALLFVIDAQAVGIGAAHGDGGGTRINHEADAAAIDKTIREEMPIAAHGNADEAPATCTQACADAHGGGAYPQSGALPEYFNACLLLSRVEIQEFDCAFAAAYCKQAGVGAINDEQGFIAQNSCERYGLCCRQEWQSAKQEGGAGC